MNVGTMYEGMKVGSDEMEYWDSCDESVDVV